jgi:protein-L-isoaspartate(D-aspartate) O-methyltransferase
MSAHMTRNSFTHPVSNHHDVTRMVQNMIAGQLATNSVVSTPILQAVTETKREDFVPDNLRGAAYVDDNLDVGNGRQLLSPLTFTRLLSLAGITPSCRVLDIGCLNGYTTAILSRIAGHVVAIDTDADCIAKAKTLLKGEKDLDIQHVKSLADGYGTSAPYDVIVIEGAINFVPEALGLQLSEGGCIVTVFRKDNQQYLTNGLGKGMVIRRLDGSLQYREHFDAAALVLDGFVRESGFTL